MELTLLDDIGDVESGESLDLPGELSGFGALDIFFLGALGAGGEGASTNLIDNSLKFTRQGELPPCPDALWQFGQTRAALHGCRYWHRHPNGSAGNDF